MALVLVPQFYLQKKKDIYVPLTNSLFVLLSPFLLEGLFPFRYWRPTIPILERSIPDAVFKDPWAKREAWRSHPFFSRRNRVMAMFPGLGIGSAAFIVYLAYDHWYQTSGPGKEENEKWAKWMEERNQRLHHHGHGNGHH